MRSFLALAVVVGLLIGLVRCVFVGPPEPVKEALPTTVSQEEMSRFLHTWSEFLQSNINKKELEQLSLGNSEPSEKTKEWLQKRGWNSERFFYVEQRLRAIVKTAALKEHSEKTIEMLRARLRTPKDKNSKAEDTSGIQNMIELQKKNFNVEGITEEEINMIGKNPAYIENILNGNAKL